MANGKNGVGTVIQGRFGTVEIVGFDGSIRREIYRLLKPTTSWEARGISERAHSTGPGDVSPHHATYPDGYVAACGWCWLGYPHTEDAHAAKIGGAR